jgi:predicted PurR-regulated permease PerM
MRGASCDKTTELRRGLATLLRMIRSRGEPVELARSALQLLALGVLIAAGLWIVRPFLVPGIWAIMLGIALWPLLLRAQAACGGRRAPAVGLLTLALLLTLLAPLYLGVRAIVANADDFTGWLQSFQSSPLPQPPAWVERVPLVGSDAAARWRDLADEGPREISARLAPQLRQLARTLVREVGSLGFLVLHFLLTTILAAILFARGETAAEGMRRFAHRLAGARGEQAALLAVQAIRAVALGVVLTAVIQTALVGLGFAVIGVPFAAILLALSFMLSVAQIGPTPILIGVVVWVYSTQGAAWGSAYLLWAVLCAAIDNVIRPLLIRRGADLPLLLIFGGVIGGLVAFGVIGLFIGPVVLAVAYTLLVEWVDEDPGKVLAQRVVSGIEAPEVGHLDPGASTNASATEEIHG